MADPEAAVIAKINGNGGWVTNTNLFRGPVLPAENNEGTIPRYAVFVQYTGGPEPIDFSGAGTVQEYEHNVQVMLRGEPDAYGSARTAAQVIYALLHDQDPNGYIYMRATTGQAVWLGQDEDRSHLFVINVRLGILE